MKSSIQIIHLPATLTIEAISSVDFAAAPT